ncbi:MAG: hypothetical protein NC318_08025 [Blautia sp.]|nr:hypothetical protein [Blautia sp.]
MPHYAKLWKTKLPQILFYIGLTIELAIVLIDKSDYINPIEGQLFRITFLLFAMKLLLTEYTWKEWCLIVILEGVGLISYQITGKNDIIRIVTFVSACKGIPLKQMLRYTFYVTLLGCAAIVLLSVSGIYGRMSLTADFGREFNLDTRQGVEETRYTLGMGHPNALASMYLMLLALGIYVFFERMKWYVYLFILLLNVGVYKLTDSKTAMLLATALLFASFLVTYVKALREKKFAYLAGFLVLALCIGFSVDAAAQAPKVRKARWNLTYKGEPRSNAHVVALLRIDAKISGRIVSLTDSERNDGSIETWSLFSCPENMEYYFDMGWVKLFYRYGVLPGILYCIANFALLWQFYRKKDASGLVIFTILAVYSVVEAHLFSVYIGRNFLLMMMGSYFFPFRICAPTENDFVRIHLHKK